VSVGPYSRSSGRTSDDSETGTPGSSSPAISAMRRSCAAPANELISDTASEGRVVGWASMFGHMSDVGGKTPCSMPTDARTIYEEGVVIPPFKLYRRGS
jgi:hypothetical protein